VAAGSDARDAAYGILSRVRGGQPFDAALDHTTSELEAVDRRLAHEIAAGVLRSRSELDRQLAPLVSASWGRTPDGLKDLLRIGAYQLIVLTRVPSYAAVQATVEAAKSVHGKRGAGMVNAVLRRLEREGAAPLPDEAGLAQRFSHPDWLVARWQERFGTERTTALLEHNNRRPALVVQPARGSAAELRTSFAAAGIEVRDAPLGSGLVVAEPPPVSDLPGFAAGLFVVQDAAQARLLEFAAVPEGALVWDACAAPGGKAAALARTCRVVASELRRERLASLKDTAARAAPGADLLLADALDPPIRPGAADAVLLDAPCSATGTVARHPDARWRLSPEGIARQAGRQAALLDRVAPVVGTGGLLLYMTCSLEPEENEAQVDAFLQRHSEFAREGDDLFIFPPDAGTDGGYAARLRRTA
jgi:16S rRNA (cytosine967-C5)-methyltransferase